MPHPDMPSDPRAQPPRPPAATPELERIRVAEQLYKEDREREQRRSLMRGLLWLLLAVMVFSILRAGMEQVFLRGWWRP